MHDPIITRRDALVASGAALAGLSFPFAAQAEDIRKGGTLVVASTQTPRHLNGAVQSGIATAFPSTQLFASPLRFDDKYNPQPYLAETWKLADDGKSLTLNLRRNAVFHDGKPVTSADVAFSVMAIKANHPFQTMMGPVEKVDTPDPYTAVIRMSVPHPAIVLAMSPALCPILPKHVYDDGKDLKTNPKNGEGLIGSGPYRLSEFKPVATHRDGKVRQVLPSPASPTSTRSSSPSRPTRPASCSASTEARCRCSRSSRCLPT